MLKKHFNKASHTYDQHAVLQKYVGEKLLALIKANNFLHHHIIDIGCGTGLMTQEIATQLSYQTFHAIDIAENLLAVAKEKLKHHPIQFFESNFDTFESHMQYDLIFANMSLHWSDNIIVTIQRLLNKLKKNGKLVFSIPLTDTFIELKTYLRLRQFNDIQQILDVFRVSLHFSEKITYSFSSLREALHSIKKTGANHVNNRLPGLQCNPFLKKLLLNPTHDSTTLTYHIGYFVVESSHDN